MNVRSRILLVPLALVACAPALTPATAADARDPAADAPAPPPAMETRPAAAGAGPRVSVERVEPGNAELEQALRAALEKRVRGCEAGSGSRVVRMRVDATREGTKVAFTSGDALEPSSRKCALAALAAIESAEIPTRATASVPPSGFTVLLRIEW
jgi:hypothetical protein